MVVKFEAFYKRTKMILYVDDYGCVVDGQGGRWEGDPYQNDWMWTLERMTAILGTGTGTRTMMKGEGWEEEVKAGWWRWVLT